MKGFCCEFYRVIGSHCSPFYRTPALGYNDKATGVMEKVDGKLIVSRVELNPTIVYAGEPPTAATQAELHHLAHEQCFIANSVKTEIQVAN